MVWQAFSTVSAWFVLSLIALAVIQMTCAENEKWGLGGVWLGVWIALAVLFTDFNPMPWILGHLILAPLMAAAYVAAGMLYALLRWELALRDPASYARKYDTVDEQGKVLDYAKFRDRIITWMVWWWASAILWMLRWPRKLFTSLYEAMSSLLRSMAESHARK